MNICQRNSSMENYKSENAPMVVRQRDTRTPSKPQRLQHTNTLVGTDCTGSSKVARPYKEGVGGGGAGEYEENRTSKTEQKRAQRKARTKTFFLRPFLFYLQQAV